MRFGAAFWIQRTTWPALRAAVEAAEAAGFDSLWLDDHLLSDEGDWTDGKLEGWATAAAVAAVTTRPTIGHLVSANTFRNPGLTAKLATTLDAISGGRAVLGLGGGWFEREHEAFGLDFGASTGERLDRFEEATGLVRRLLDGERVTHAGRFYAFEDAVCEPRPVQARLPILVGGSGRTKTLRTTARHADLWNGYGEPERIAETLGHLRARCAEEGRAFDEIGITVTMDACIRATPEAAREAFRRTEELHGIVGRIGSDGQPRGLRAAGPSAAIADYLRPFAELGVGEVMWIFRDPYDTDTMRRLPEVRRALA
jgi:alkanesulfonate monooxygenase SsuD/methylene tetrahydromethanopterin reductase-like flavin-dependent oxidoreductase (luciferase family)